MAKRLKLASSNLHELAHMWFGNLVTMKWWNDLWLNEAFATALSHYCCANGKYRIEEFNKESWLAMNLGKTRGIAEDMLPTNHCVSAHCPDTDAAESLFDALTYQKGCSLVKQMIFLMDWDTFCAGIKIYFKKFKWGNTTLNDFITCMQQGYDALKGQE